MSNKNENIDVSFLLERRLQQLALGIYEFQLNFSEEVSISVQQKVFIENMCESTIEILANDPAQTKELFFLLGKTIKNVEMNEQKNLKIIFDNQCKIIIPPSENDYDSYVIWDKGDWIAV